MDVPTYLNATAITETTARNDKRKVIQSVTRMLGVGYSKLTVTGESTTCTFPSSIKISRALRHSLFTCSSDIGSHLVSCSIWLR